MSQHSNPEEMKMSHLFAVDNDHCIRCASCSSIAPANFRVETTGAIILRQPVNQSELKQCETALINCPTSAITATPAYAASNAH